MDGLRQYFGAFGLAHIALSGGIDSTLLCRAAADALGTKALAVTVVTEFTSKRDIAFARRAAGLAGIRHRLVRASVLGTVKNNPKDRCYHCKRLVMSHLPKPGFDGTNATDSAERPGIRALSELGIRSPYRELGITKARIIRTSESLGLPVHPSNSCLATRIPHNTQITRAVLAEIERIEEELFCMGYDNVRARWTKAGYAIVSRGKPVSPVHLEELGKTARIAK